MNFAVCFFPTKIEKQGRISDDKGLKAKTLTFFHDGSDLGVLLGNVIEGIEGEMHRPAIGPHQLRQNLQLTERAQLHLIIQHLPPVEGQRRPVLPAPLIGHITAEKFIRPGLGKPDIFVHRPKACHNLHTFTFFIRD